MGAATERLSPPGVAGELGRCLSARMGELTWARIGPMALENARRNAAAIATGGSLADLRDRPPGRGNSAVVIAAGPSLRRHDPVPALVAAGYDGCVICTESALRHCLRGGLRPDLVVTADPHPGRIVRWFGDPRLTAGALEADDYFRRQDLDEGFAAELEANREVMALLADQAPRLRIALSTASSPDVVERVHELRMDVYWWNPMLDDPDIEEGSSAFLMRANGRPCLNAGGNVGTAAWMLAHAVLGKARVALTGMDLGYYADTPYRQTQYYREALELFGAARLEEFFIPVYNPVCGEWFFTDPAYQWYRECFLELAEEAQAVTFNCTGGGTLFGGPIRSATLDQFLRQT